jgi:hypothetical protein
MRARLTLVSIVLLAEDISVARPLPCAAVWTTGSDYLFEHDLFRKPLHTFRDHALRCNGTAETQRPVALCMRATPG